MNAQAAVVQGLELARTIGAEVTIMSIIDVQATVSIQQGLGMPDVYGYQQKAAEAAVEMAMKAAAKAGVKATPVVARGSPAPRYHRCLQGP